MITSALCGPLQVSVPDPTTVKAFWRAFLSFLIMLAICAVRETLLYMSDRPAFWKGIDEWRDTKVWKNAIGIGLSTGTAMFLFLVSCENLPTAVAITITCSFGILSILGLTILG